MGVPDLDFQLVFESSPEVLLVLLPDAPRFTMVAATRARFEATQTTEDTLGKGLFEVFPDNPADPDATGTSNLRASLERVIATREPDTMAVQKYDIQGPDGTFTPKYWSPKNLPVLSASGELLYILHRVEDVTELVQANELGEEKEREVVKRSVELAAANKSLREANAKLGQLNAAKTAFFSNVSHEFRTPLTLMLGPLSDALTDAAEPLPPAQHGRLALAHDNALRLLKLVNALLDFSRLEAGRLRPKPRPLDISAATSKLAGMFQSAFDKAGVELVMDLAPLETPAWVDPEMWERIVLNLISNAFKFTLGGSVTVGLREEHDSFVLEVADTGVGIPTDDLPLVFERFHRVAGTRGRTHEGAGIGLSLVRELAELQGGTVSVESVLGTGSTFRVVFPKCFEHLPAEFETAAGHTEPTRDAHAHASEAKHWVADQPDSAATRPTWASGPRARVLVVDDNAELREYMAGILEPYYDVAVASDGQDALDAIRAAAPEVVVSDVMMPRLDGIGMVRAIRDDPATRSLPVILLSARAGAESSVEGLDAGADDYVLKPFSARELIARVRTHVELAQTRRAFITELERTNSELEAFSYSVSHDLRAPLRAIDGFSRALVEEHGSTLDARATHYLDRIQNASGRMGQLIEDLLALSRVARAELTRRSVDLGALALPIVAELRRSDPGRDVAVQIEDGLVAHADPRLLEIVLRNLIGNAWKYTARTPTPRIEIGRHLDAESAFFVRDNGAGFDLAYADKLFAPFQRLHAAHEFEGTGVGLSTVQRVIHRHGGRVWADSAVEHGATFYFTLPAEDGIRGSDR